MGKIGQSGIAMLVLLLQLGKPPINLGLTPSLPPKRTGLLLDFDGWVGNNRWNSPAAGKACIAIAVPNRGEVMGFFRSKLSAQRRMQRSELLLEALGDISGPL